MCGWSGSGMRRESKTCRRLPRKNGKRIFRCCDLLPPKPGARGLQFQLGIWTHAYEWTDSPHAHHRIEGLTPETHAAYSPDALAMILKACPEIQGLTMRVHGESGIPEGSYPFWKTLFEAISGCGRKIEIDMHAKGVNQTMIDMATATGMPVKLGAKYSAEHQSLGYNQADIRAAGDTGARPHGKRAFSASAMARAGLPATAMPTSCSRAATTICSFAYGRERSGICFPATRRWRRLSDALPASAARSGWILWSRSPSRVVRVPDCRAAVVLTRTHRSIRRRRLEKVRILLSGLGTVPL